MNNLSVLRLFTLTILAALLVACGSIDKRSTTEVPVEERDHGPISTYRLLPPEPEATPEPAPGKVPGSAISHLHADAKKQLAAKQYNSAVSTLERALRIAPRNAELWHSLAVARLQQRRWDMARNLAAKSNSLAAADRALQARNWRLIANSHQAQGNTSAALQAWQRARDLGRR